MPRAVFITILLALAVIAVYWPVLGFEFVEYDDPQYVRDQPAVLAGLTTEGIVWAFTTDTQANWHPLTWISYMADAQINRTFGLNPNNPIIFHATNIAFHAMNVCLLFHLLLSLTGAFWRSACVAGLLAIHPIHVESVAWVSERKDVLSMFFLLLTIRSYVRYVREDDWRSYGLACVFLALGLTSKAMLVTLPIALLLLDFWPLRRMPWQARSNDASTSTPMTPTASIARIILDKLPLLALVIAASFLTYMAQIGAKHLEDGVWIPLSTKLENGAVAYIRYIGTLFWPANLAALYPNPGAIGLPFWESREVIAAIAGLLTITVIAAVLRRRWPYLIIGWLWFLGTMVPVLGIVQIGRQSMADRYAYIPFIGLYIMIAWGVADLTARWRQRTIPLAFVASLALAALAALAHRQVWFWRNSTVLFEHAISVTKNNWLMHHNYAVMLSRAGERDKALAQIDIAMSINPDCWWMHSYRGLLLLEKEEVYEAQRCFEKALSYRPDDFELLHGYGVILTKRNLMTQAIDAFRRSLASQPDYFDSRKALAVTLAHQGDRAEARRVLEEGIKLSPKREKEYRELMAMLGQP